MHHARCSFSLTHLSAPASALLLLCAAALPLRAQNVNYGAGQTAAGTITNNSPDTLTFESDASAGSASITNNSTVFFTDNSSADSASVTNSAASTIYFRNFATAGNASIINDGSLAFFDASSVGAASITNHSEIYFFGTSTADNASFDSSTLLDLSFHTGGLSLGSLAGSGGTLYLGTNAHTVGGLNTSTTYSGVIADGGSNGGTGGSLVKTGTGILTLTGGNTYTGGTTIGAGALQLGANDALGTGSLTLAGGTLDLANFSQTGGTLTVADNSFIDFGTLASALTLADSNALAWSGTLTVLNFTNGVDFFRLGTDAGGLTADQLGRINFNGFTAHMDSAGYLTAIPEPSTYAAILGLGALGLAAARRGRPLFSGFAHASHRKQAQ